VKSLRTCRLYFWAIFSANSSPSWLALPLKLICLILIFSGLIFWIYFLRLLYVVTARKSCVKHCKDTRIVLIAHRDNALWVVRFLGSRQEIKIRKFPVLTAWNISHTISYGKEIANRIFPLHEIEIDGSRVRQYRKNAAVGCIIYYYPSLVKII